MYCTPVLFDYNELKLYLLECCSTASVHQKQLKYMLISKRMSLKAASAMQYTLQAHK